MTLTLQTAEGPRECVVVVNEWIGSTERVHAFDGESWWRVDPTPHDGCYYPIGEVRNAGAKGYLNEIARGGGRLSQSSSSQVFPSSSTLIWDSARATTATRGCKKSPATP